MPEHVIEIVDLCKSLGGKQVLNRLCLQVRRGETFVIIGRSGTGKSVTLKHIIGLMKPDSGTCTVFGTEMGKATRAEAETVRRRIGYLFQSGALLASMNVEDNVALPLREIERMPEDQVLRTVREKLDLVDLDKVELKMPSELSGGMRKRVGLARAISRNPELVLYDEPTSGLDPIGTAAIDELILSMKKKLKVTQIVVTHDMASARRIADRIGLLYDGRIYFTGTPADLDETTDVVVHQFVHGEVAGPMTEKSGETKRYRRQRPPTPPPAPPTPHPAPAPEKQDFPPPA
ncbi:MAG: ABC transporter ATP-binding protein [Planctomycetia bacterium]|nr:ABC transporter ATP-binding protein [Planctomycetia bacterium]